MKKWIIYILVIAILTSFAYAIPLCEDRIEENRSCEIVTPQIGCDTYNITETATSVRVVNDSSLTLINNNVYKLEFNQSEGEYVVALCSGHTTTIRVNETYDAKFQEEKSSRMFIAVGIILAIVIFVLVLFALYIERLEFKILFSYLAGLMIIFGFRFASIVVGSVTPSETGLVSNLDTFYGIAIVIWRWLFYLLILYLFFRALKVLQESMKKKRKREETGWLMENE